MTLFALCPLDRSKIQAGATCLRKGFMHEQSTQDLSNILPDNQILTASEVALALRISEETVRRWADQWRDSGGHEGLPAFKVGKQWRFSRQAVYEYVILGQ